MKHAKYTIVIISILLSSSVATGCRKKENPSPAATTYPTEAITFFQFLVARDGGMTPKAFADCQDRIVLLTHDGDTQSIATRNASGRAMFWARVFTEKRGGPWGGIFREMLTHASELDITRLSFMQEDYRVYEDSYAAWELLQMRSDSRVLWGWWERQFEKEKHDRYVSASGRDPHKVFPRPTREQDEKGRQAENAFIREYLSMGLIETIKKHNTNADIAMRISRRFLWGNKWIGDEWEEERRQLEDWAAAAVYAGLKLYLEDTNDSQEAEWALGRRELTLAALVKIMEESEERHHPQRLLEVIQRLLKSSQPSGMPISSPMPTPNELMAGAGVWIDYETLHVLRAEVLRIQETAGADDATAQALADIDRLIKLYDDNTKRR